MSQLLIQHYYNDLAALKRVAGTNRESVVREAFKDLLKAWGRSQDLDFVAEYKIETKTKERRYVDGALLYTLRVPFGYWEAKDSDDDLDTEIDKKFRAGYPRTNTIFEDSTQAVLYQHGEVPTDPLRSESSSQIPWHHFGCGSREAECVDHRPDRPSESGGNHPVDRPAGRVP